MTFTTTAEPRPRGGIAIRLPFDPASAWGERDRYYLEGTINQYGMRGVVAEVDGRPMLQLGPSWCRDPRVGPGATLEVSLQPEGPQLDTIADDLADALNAEPKARHFFESLATFYRKGFVNWVESAKRPETRATRISQTGAALKAGRRER
jgi:hypothetical protein